MKETNKPNKSEEYSDVHVRVPLIGKREATIIRYYLALETYYWRMEACNKPVQWGDLLTSLNLPSYPLLKSDYGFVEIGRACDAYNLLTNSCNEVKEYITNRATNTQPKVVSLTECSDDELYAEIGRRSCKLKF